MARSIEAIGRPGQIWRKHGQGLGGGQFGWQVRVELEGDITGTSIRVQFFLQVCCIIKDYESLVSGYK